MVGALPGMAFVTSPVQGAEAFGAFQDHRAFGQCVTEGAGGFALFVDDFWTEAQAGIRSVALGFYKGVLDRAVPEAVDDLQVESAV